MVEFAYVIQGHAGLHARPVAMICSFARTHEPAITLTCGNQTVAGDDIMGVMGLNGCQGDELRVTVDGPNEVAVARDFRQVLEENL